MTAHRLARVRRVRELEERVRRADWARGERAAAEAEAAVNRALDAVGSARRRLAARRAGGLLAPREVLVDEASLDRLDAAVDDARVRAAECRRAADLLREPWREKRVEAEALLRLEQRWRAARRHAREDDEQREQDERALTRAHDDRPVPEGSPRRPRPHQPRD